jgi:hypothetical protein
MGDRLFRQKDTNRMIAEALVRAKTENLRDVFMQQWVVQRMAEEREKYEAAKKLLLWRERLNRGWEP